MMKWIQIFLILTLSVLQQGCLDIDQTDPAFESGQVSPDNEAAVSMASAGGAPSVSAVKWLDFDISGWPETAILSASVSGGSVNLNYDKSNSWPASSIEARGGGKMNANAWVIVNLDGQWYGATWEWLRVGQTVKAASSVTSKDGHIGHPLFKGWSPKSGESYGFLVSTPARWGTQGSTINERSNISMVAWP
jgi:hypothetical protein